MLCLGWFWRGYWSISLGHVDKLESCFFQIYLCHVKFEFLDTFQNRICSMSTSTCSMSTIIFCQILKTIRKFPVQHCMYPSLVAMLVSSREGNRYDILYIWPLNIVILRWYIMKPSRSWIFEEKIRSLPFQTFQVPKTLEESSPI